jgi:hypothetical protein
VSRRNPNPKAGPLTLVAKRKMLADILNTTRTLPGVDSERLLHEQHGGDWYDQHRATVAEARVVTDRATEVPNTKYANKRGIYTREGKAMVLAAVMRCLAHSRCEHATGGGRPLIAALAARVITCDACFPRFRGAIAAHDHLGAAGTNSMCDFCLEERTSFHPSLVHFGPVRVIGDMCDECYAAAGDQAVAS